MELLPRQGCGNRVLTCAVYQDEAIRSTAAATLRDKAEEEKHGNMHSPVIDVETLTRNWWAVLLRGLAGIVFGIIAFFAPGVSFAALVLVFGAYAAFSTLPARSAGAVRLTAGGCCSWREPLVSRRE